MEIAEKLYSIQNSIPSVIPELTLALGMIVVLILGFFKPKSDLTLIVAALTFATAILFLNFPGPDGFLFGRMIGSDGFSDILKQLIDFSALLTCVMSIDRSRLGLYRNEFAFLLIAIVFGAHLLTMSNNLLMIFLSMELVSIGSYILVAYSFNKHASESSLKYFMFGSAASAVMLYGFSLLYGQTGILEVAGLALNGRTGGSNAIFLIGGCMSLAGFLFKMSAVPMHPWVPDVYQGASFPVIAFLSTVPKLAGLGAMSKFIFPLIAYRPGGYDWQFIIALLAIVSITVGNLAALSQKNPKRLMAYSSIAQSGFLMICMAAFTANDTRFMLFYAAIYVLMNFSVFIYLAFFEARGIKTVEDFSGVGKANWFPMVLLLVGLIGLTGLPPTAGFTGKLFIFSSVWESYQVSGKAIMRWVLVLGLLNTVISLFYYLKIPYYAFLRPPQAIEIPADISAGLKAPKPRNFATAENLLGLILVLIILALFVAPGLLMGWINKVNFAF